ncbi:MAG: hypothetical protein KF777_03435 [Planctomycetaceae bacterium]|nr:hypothetical protein [Planctomycetaceae bacterium]
MSRESQIGVAIVLLLLSGLLLRAALADQPWGVVTVLPVENDPAEAVREVSPETPGVQVSVARTTGLWLAAFFTLACYSYLYKDNPAYKLTESIIVGVSAGYWLTASFWDVIVGKALARLMPEQMRAWALPNLDPADPDFLTLVPLTLGALLFARLIPGGAWLARWPLALIVGTTAGLKLVLYLDGDFVSQIRNTILPLVVFNDNAFDLDGSARNILLVTSVLCCLTYFYFSVEHRGAVGRVSRCGIWVLMITFGSSFAFTVMGRITLLTMRLEFLFRDWLGLLPPNVS